MGRTRAIAAAFASLLAWSAAAQEVEPTAPLPPPPPDGVAFTSVRDLKQVSGDIEPMLRGGAVADSATWPASFFFTYLVGKKTYVCTAALVGPETLLTAAHCLPPSRIVKVRFGTSGYDATCGAHEDYANRADLSADFALCRLEKPFQEPAGFRYERVRRVAWKDIPGGKVMLGGFGCTKDVVAEAEAEETDLKYRVGFGIVKEGSASTPHPSRAKLYAPYQHFNIITSNSQANLCPGDSGGPVFLLSAQGYPQRSIIAVNSRVLFADYPSNTKYGGSVLSSLDGPVVGAPSAVDSFWAWARTWAGDDGRICGLVGQLTNCREY